MASEIPKRRTKKGKKGKKSFEIDANFVKEYTSTKSLSLEEIDNYIKRLVNEYEKEKENRLYFQLERDKIIEIREVEKRKFQDLKSELLSTHERMKSLEQEHYDMTSLLKQKVRYLMSEQQAKVNSIKYEIQKNGKQNIDDGLKERETYAVQLRQFIAKLQVQEDQYEDMIKNLTHEYENRASKMRHEHFEKMKTLHKTMESRFSEERTQFSLLMRNAVHEITERKNAQIANLNKIHTKSYDNLRNYFKDLINSSMLMVSDLRQENSGAIVKQKDSVQKARQIEGELKTQIDKNIQLNAEYTRLMQKSSLYEAEKRLFKHNNEELSKLKEKYSKIDIKYESLLKSYSDLKRDYDAVLRNVEASSLVFQEKCNNRVHLANRKVEVLEKELQRYGYFSKDPEESQDECRTVNFK